MVTTEKQEYQIFYNPQENEVYGDILVKLTKTQESIDRQIELEFSGGEFYPLSLSHNIDNIYLPSFIIGNFAQNVPTENKTFYGIFKIKSSTSDTPTEVGRFTIVFNITTEKLIISKEEITLRKDIQSETEAEGIINFRNLSWNPIHITAPNNISVEYNPTEKNGTIKIKTNDESKFWGDKFEVNITVSNGAVSKQIIVKVEQFKFTEWVFFPEDSYFCLDKRKIRIEKYKDEGKYARITLDFRVRNIPYTASYVVPYFQNEVRFDMGEKIHQYAMAQIEKDIIFNPGDEIYLSPIITNMKIEELNKDYQALYSSNLNGIKFYPGKTPKLYPIFSNHNIRRRVEDSKVLVGFENTELSFDELPKIDKRNQRQRQYGVMIQELTTDNSLFAKVHNIRELKIITMPKTGETINVKWLNQNGVIEWATFSGEWKIETAAKNTIRKSIFSNQNKKFDASLEEILKLNTGFIFLAEVKMIREMMLSPLCEVSIGERKIICIPNTEKIISEDSTRQLIAFDLDFLITFERPQWK